MDLLKEYYIEHVKLDATEFEDLHDDEIEAIKNTLGYQTYIASLELNKSWDVVREEIIKSANWWQRIIIKVWFKVKGL
jgi:hypothetical protein